MIHCGVDICEGVPPAQGRVCGGARPACAQAMAQVPQYLRLWPPQCVGEAGKVNQHSAASVARTLAHALGHLVAIEWVSLVTPADRASRRHTQALPGCRPGSSAISVHAEVASRGFRLCCFWAWVGDDELSVSACACVRGSRRNPIALSWGSPGPEVRVGRAQESPRDHACRTLPVLTQLSRPPGRALGFSGSWTSRIAGVIAGVGASARDAPTALSCGGPGPEVRVGRAQESLRDHGCRTRVAREERRSVRLGSSRCCG